jgi:hypothetical protein
VKNWFLTVYSKFAFNFNSYRYTKAGEFAWQMGEMVANLIRRTEGYEHVRQGACIAECGNGAGILVAPDYTDVVRDPEAGKPKCEAGAYNRPLHKPKAVLSLATYLPPLNKPREYLGRASSQAIK